MTGQCEYRDRIHGASSLNFLIVMGLSVFQICRRNTQVFC